MDSFFFFFPVFGRKVRKIVQGVLCEVSLPIDNYLTKLPQSAFHIFRLLTSIGAV